MSQRYDPASNNRFPRDRSPPRNSSANNRTNLTDHRLKDNPPASEPPRGPRALTESHRGYGHPPLRGRGFSGRGEYRPDYRDRESFRRDSSPLGARRWSPSSERFSGGADYRDGTRDSEFGRGRRGYRDVGPSRYIPEGRGGQSYHPGRDDVPRGRGRFEWPSRGRGRGGYYDDRASFRGRSRSPPPRRERWERSPSRERRPPPLDRYEDSRVERRGSEKSYDRDERPREEPRFRGDRYPPEPSPTTPQLYRPSLNTPLSANRIPQDSDRDAYPLRRVPSAPDVTVGREQRYDSFKPDAFAKQETKTNEQDSSRTSSPPRAPEVPAFGSLPFKATSSETKWNQWIAPEQKQAPAPARSPPPPPPLPPPASQEQPTPSPSLQDSPMKPLGSKTGRSSPRLDAQQLAPKAPRAQRRDASPTTTEASEVTLQVKQESPKLAPLSETKSIEPPMNAPTGPAQKARDPSPSVLRSPPTGPRQLSGVPSGPKASVSPLIGRSGQSMPAFNLPAGPRVGAVLKSPVSASVPTGPRADRTGPNSARPHFSPAGSTSWQWNRPDTSTANPRGGLIPAKRDFSGEKKESDIPRVQESSRSEYDAHEQSASPSFGDEQMDDAPRLDGTEREPHPQTNGEDANVRESASDEDAMDIDDDDAAKRELTFQQDRARLQSKMIDLSSRHLRGSSPLQKLNLLGRLTLEDLSSFFDAPRSRKPTGQRNFSQPDGIAAKEEVPTNEAEAKEKPQIVVPRVRPPPPKPAPKLSPSPIGTPEIRSLPFLSTLPLTPISELDAFQESLKRHEHIRESLQSELGRRNDEEGDQEGHLRVEYEQHYRLWRQHVTELDMQKAREEAVKQDVSENHVPVSATETSPPLTTAAEPRRRGMHATDYELEKVLEMSKIEAEKEAQEKREKDAANAKPNWELEAYIPELTPPCQTNIAQFSDTSCLRDASDLCSLWELQPPQDNFSQEEHDTMLQNFKDFPKKFGKIADGLDGRSYKDCINHYYATKWNGQYKPPRDKRKRAKNPRVKTGPNQRPRANALISNLEDANPDLYDGEDASAPLNAYTVSGRPKRAAAPTFKDKEGGEQANMTTPAKKSIKADLPLERTVEKSGKKPRAAAKETRPRKVRNQALARRDSKSPEKNDSIPGALEMGQPSIRDLDGASSLAALGAGQPPLLQRPSNAPSFAVEPSHSRPPLLPEAGKIQTVRSGHTTGTSSYWSVQEVDLFPQLIDKYGTDWTSIAQEMGTKSHTMVKNYFGRLKNKGPEIEARANEANERRNKGEQPGPMPTPSLSRRIKENVQPSQPRNLAPTSEVIDLDDTEKPSATVPRQGSARESIHPSYTPGDSLAPRTSHERSTSASRPFPSAPFQVPQATYTSTSQAPPDTRQFPPREPAVTASTPADLPYAPISRPMEYGSIPGVPTSLSRQPYLSGPAVFEDLIQRQAPRPLSSIPASEGTTSMYGPVTSVHNTATRPQPTERSLSDDMQRVRGASPPPPSNIRHLMETSRPQSIPNVERVRPPAPLPLTREDVSISARPPEKPAPPPAPSKPEPRKSNLRSILNNDEPEEPRPRPSLQQPVRQNPTPPQYGAAPPPSYPPRPSSRVERSEYPREHGRNPSMTYQPSFLQPSHQPRPNVDGRPIDNKLAPGTFHLEWPHQADQRPSEPTPSVDHRSSMHHRLDSRYNPSPPPFAHRDSGPGSGTNSPFNQRIPLQHLTGRHEPSPPPPPTRSYSLAAPPSHSHSRDASISALNRASRPPPPSVLQPQHQPRQPPPMVSQPPPIMQPGIISRADATPSYTPTRNHEMPTYGSSSRDLGPERSVYPSRMSDPNVSAHSHNAAAESSYDPAEKARIWSMVARDEDREPDRRTTDWTRGLAREPRYGPAGGVTASGPPPPQQYAPYNPLGDERRGEREGR